ncbi:MAG TPA: hypothetical protein VMU84_17645 [Thermoanaerobaculia bacterium]|nr:hypothetical protein [Thermoanaerobaculia bacterium]
MSVDVKEAVAHARDYLVSIFPVTGRVELEEVEPYPDQDDPGWRITFSYDRDEPDPLGLTTFLPPQHRPKRRVYKVVSVRGDGTPESVKIRSGDTN